MLRDAPNLLTGRLAAAFEDMVSSARVGVGGEEEERAGRSQESETREQEHDLSVCQGRRPGYRRPVAATALCSAIRAHPNASGKGVQTGETQPAAGTRRPATDSTTSRGRW